MLLLGLDIGTSSIKASVIDSNSIKVLKSANYPEEEAKIDSPAPGWAEQSPEMWWESTRKAIQKLKIDGDIDLKSIGAIGISYQMHGLVTVDQNQNVLRPSIIWCDSRAVEIGNKAFESIGQQKSLEHLLNSPGNFTASKLAWVKENEPATYEKIDKIMLPGDYIAMKLTGEVTTSISSLSEGIFWDFKSNELSQDVFSYFGFEKSLIPIVNPVFSVHGHLKDDISNELGLPKSIPVSYKAGDQPNNALSLNVLNPGEVAATAGTSGVIYAVSDELVYDKQSRVNTFAHVNYTGNKNRQGILLCINGTGILNRWVKTQYGNGLTYPEMNRQAGNIPVGSEGITVMPFGNGAERMLNNKLVGAHILGLDFNRHDRAHIFRAAQEGIAFAFRYGLDIMRENGIEPRVIRAGKANMFLSDVFIEAFVNVTNTPVELYNNDGSVGAAIGAGIGMGAFKDFTDAFNQFKPITTVIPDNTDEYEEAYGQWKEQLLKYL